MLSRDLAVLGIATRGELTQAGSQGTASTALSSAARAGDGANLARRIDGNVGEGKEDIALTTSGLQRETSVENGRGGGKDTSQISGSLM